MKGLRYIFRRHRKSIALMCLFLLLSTAADLALPSLMSRIVNVGINGRNMSVIVVYSVVMVAVAAAGLTFLIISVKFGARMSADVSADLREEVFAKTIRLSAADAERFGAGALLTRTTDDIWMMEEFLFFAVRGAVTIPVLTLGGAVLALLKDPFLALILFAFVPVIIVIIGLVAKKILPLIEKADLYIDKQNTIMRERMTGIRVIRAFNKEEREHKKMESATVTMARNIIKCNALINVMNPVGIFILNAVTALIVYVGAVRMGNGSVIGAGDVVAVIQYVALMMGALMMFSYAIVMLPKFRVSYRRVCEVLKSTTRDTETDGIAFEGSIRAENLGYTFGGAERPSLSGIDFEIGKGEIVALIGGTGAGKTTLLNLLTGAFGPTEGRLFLDGRDYQSMCAGDVASAYSVSFQRCDIFSGTVAENVSGFRDSMPAERIKEATDVAQLTDFIEENGGTDYAVMQAGGNLSGGQKQRVSIARTIARDAAVYVFDDSFSALDYLTEYKLRSRLRAFLAGKTQIIATQRIATARNCDKIFVLDKGRLCGCGTHDELMKTCETYREIYSSQIGGDRD